MNNPIVIIGAPRSFTSLIAGIFKDHGVWTGKTKEYPACPTGSIENSRMRRLLKSNGNTAANGVVNPIINDFKPKILNILYSEDYKAGPYLFKCPSTYAPSWYEFEPKFIKCHRPKEAVMKSLEKADMLAPNGDSYETYQRAMDDTQGVDVYGEEFFKGDWSSLEKAFEFCGLGFNQQIAENLLEHKHKHF